jgi:hypothetical protein
MALETMTKLQTITVGSGGSTIVTFNNIPQYYTDLVIHMSARGSDSTPQEGNYIYFNNDSSSSYTYITLQGSGSAVASHSYTNIAGDIGQIPAATGTANSFSNTKIYIPNYTSNTYKTARVTAGQENNASTAYIDEHCILYSNTAPITRIDMSIYNGAATYTQYSEFTLYGIKAMRTAIGNSIKATGGAVEFDGTYVYHVFPASGTFTPTSNLTADVLVVAGGAGGGGGNTETGGGGGGAGGLLGFPSQTFSSGTSYTCTVGAGGAVGATNNAGSNGGNSQFGLLTTAIGGGGGGSAAGAGAVGNGQNGGSGGGGQGSQGNYATGGTGTSGQGYAGGGSSTGQRGTGAGGGATSAGGAGNSSGAGATGGSASSAYASWAYATSTGVGGAYAGGGGGGTTNFTSAGASGGGGGSQGATNGSTYNATANTGGGGGGASSVSGTITTGGAGGSGLIIVRYKA